MNATPTQSAIVESAQAARCDLTTIIVQMESVDGFATPVSIAASLEEMELLCADHCRSLNPDEDICPAKYVGFARDSYGKFQAVAEIEI